ncbi:MAG: 30S ribosomal protein S1 [Gemmatimonadota bacterium]
MTDSKNPQATQLSSADQSPAASDSAVGVAAEEIVDNPAHVTREPPRVGTSDELHMDPYGQEQLDISRDDFAQLLEEHEDQIGEFREGDIVNARVLQVTETAAILEFGFKSEGSVPLDEFKDADDLSEGDEVEVLLERLEDDDGIVVLSKKKADFLRVWEKIKEAYENDEPVPGTLRQKIKGGVTVDLMGVDAFLPGSQIALRRVPNIEDLVGETYDFKIIKLNKRRRNIVISRRVILEAAREEKREDLEKELLVGQVRQGQVKNITDFGAFIDLGGLDGLLHITDMSWGRVGHPSEVVDIGEELDVKVLDIDWDRERISLGLKQLLPYPWTDIDKKYPVGSRVKGRVVSITNYGAFVELEKGVEGLVHISEMSWTRNVRHPSKLVSIGDEIECVVLKVDPDDEKISLGMKQIEEDPWLALPQKYPAGTRIEGEVRNLTSFGAFVEIEPGIDGLVHVSDMSWTKRIEHPSEVVQKGETAEVVVLDVDAENKRISLGLKQLQEDPWPEITVRFAEGVETEGTVVRTQDKGLVVDLGDDIEGFVPASHADLGDSGSVEAAYFEGDRVKLKVLESDAANRRIVLEIIEILERAERPVDEGEEGVDEAEEVEADAADEVEAEVETEEVESEADEDDETESADDVEEVADEPEPEAEAEQSPEAEAAAEEAEEEEVEEESPEAEAADEEDDEPESVAEEEEESEEEAAEEEEEKQGA